MEAIATSAIAPGSLRLSASANAVSKGSSTAAAKPAFVAKKQAMAKSSFAGASVPLNLSVSAPASTRKVTSCALQGNSYPAKDIADAKAYLQRMKTFPKNYYSQILVNLGACFQGTGITIPADLARENFYVDYSTLSSERAPPELIEDALRIEGIRIYRRTLRTTPLADIRAGYGNPAAVEKENKVWWLTHCQALRDGDKFNRMFTIDGIKEEYSGLTVLFNEYRDELMYFTKDSLYDSTQGISAVPSEEGLKGYWFGREKGNIYESSWWAMLANPRVRMTWPRCTFNGEDVSFDWVCFDINTNEMTAYGDVVWIRCGDKGACYKKYEHLYFLRDVAKAFFDSYFKK
eukprot:jgi/Mesvir1/29323/Mv01578-RA.1